MNILRTMFAGAGLALLGFSVSGMPLAYDATFTSSSGPSGTGSLVWDADTLSMTDFHWDFGSGLTGGILDSALATPIAGGPRGALAWEKITGEDVHPATVDRVLFQNADLFGSYPGPGGGSVLIGHFGGPEFGDVLMGGDGIPETFGRITLSPTTSVPVPAAGWLLASGVGLLGLLRKWVAP